MRRMSLRLSTIAVSRLLAFLTAGVIAFSSPEVGYAQEQPRVDNVFFQTDLRQALEDIAAQTGINIIADPSVSGLISVTLENASIEEALDLVLAGSGYRVSKQPGYFLVYDPDANTDLFTQLADTRLIRLENLTPASARSLLPQPLQRYVRVDEASGRLAVTATEELMERIVSDLRVLDQGEFSSTTFFALEFILSENARALLPENLQRYVRVDANRNTLAVTAPEDARIEIISLLRRLDVARAPTSVEAPNVHRTHVIKLNHAKAENAIAMLPQELGQFVRADAASNTLAVSAPRQLVDGIFADIRAIDAPRRHVMLEARVVVLEKSDLLDFGTDFRWPQIQAGGQRSNAGEAYALRIGYSPTSDFTNALSLTLNLLTAQEQATIVSSPQVLAQDGVPSQIRVTTEEFFQILTDSNTLVRAQLEQIETGTILSITPRVGNDHSITLDLDLEVSDVVGRGENNLPVVSRRTAKSTVRIDDGGTAAVAGLIDARTQEGATGVPGLASIPLLGRAFRTDSLNHQARQVAIFVTAHIVDEGGKRFRTGDGTAAQIRNVTDEQYRAELEAALLVLEGKK